MSKVIAFMCCLATLAWAQEPETSIQTTHEQSPVELSRIVIPALTLQGTTPLMFAKLLKTAGISGGVATSHEQCSRGRNESVSIPDGTRLDAALELVVATEPSGIWQVFNGVTNLLPRNGAQALLQVRVASFEWDRAAPIRESIDRLKREPELVERASQLGLKEAPFEGGGSSVCIGSDCAKTVRSQVDLEVDKDKTLLMLLNIIVATHNGAVWDYAEFQCGTGTVYSLTTVSE